jgi:phosphate uptake regulator
VVHVGAMRLERIGDYAKNIAKRVAALNDNFLTGSALVRFGVIRYRVEPAASPANDAPARAKDR